MKKLNQSWIWKQIRYRHAVFIESKPWVKFKHNFIPTLKTFISKSIFILLSSMVIYFSLILFRIVELSWFNYWCTIAFYFLLEEIKDYILQLNKQNKDDKTLSKFVKNTLKEKLKEGESL